MKFLVSIISILSFSFVSAQISEVRSKLITSGSLENIDYSVSNETENQTKDVIFLSLSVSPSKREKATAKYLGKTFLMSDDLYLSFKKESRQYNDFIEILKRASLHIDSRSNSTLELESRDSKGYPYKITVSQNEYVGITKYPYPGDPTILTNNREVEHKSIKELYEKLKSL